MATITGAAPTESQETVNPSGFCMWVAEAMLAYLFGSSNRELHQKQGRKALNRHSDTAYQAYRKRLNLRYHNAGLPRHISKDASCTWRIAVQCYFL